LIRTIIMLSFWVACLPFTALVCFPYALLTGNVMLLYRVGMWCAYTGVWLAGVRLELVGLERLDTRKTTYLFMANHTSNLDPPLLIPKIPGRTSVMAKQEVFDYPILGYAMRMVSIVPVDRGNREAGIAAVQAAKKVVEQGISMTIFIEGKRSYDGKLLPFKKGPFYLAMECGAPIVPITIVGSHYVMPKKRFAIKPGKVTAIFHEPVDPKQFTDRDALMLAVREKINAGLPPEFEEQTAAAQAS
jgi:1-acyl-sn-glycerol-3-phosphate acyltransferase